MTAFIYDTVWRFKILENISFAVNYNVISLNITVFIIWKANYLVIVTVGYISVLMHFKNTTHSFGNYAKA